MPKVRDSSGTIGHHALADLLVAQQACLDAHEGHRGRDLAPSPCLELASNADSCGTSSASTSPARRQAPPRRPPALAQVAQLRAVLGGRRIRTSDLVVGRSMPKRSRNAQEVLAHLLLLVGDVLALAGLTHPVALDGLGQDHRRLAPVTAAW
jgi:hypothetical protein